MSLFGAGWGTAYGGGGGSGAMGTRAMIASHPGASGIQGTDRDGDVEGPGGVDTTRPSEMGRAAQLRILKSWWKADASHSAVWRVEAKEAFDFRAGEQWGAEDRQLLNSQQRPHIVFNRALTMLKAVAGMEINGRHEIHYIPRHNEDTSVNELLSGASKWMGDECDGEDEQSQAFENLLTCGMGWTESRLDYEEDRQGKYIEESNDPIEMYWDRTARKKNLTDARRVHRVRKMPMGDAMLMFKGKTRFQLDAVWAVGTELEEASKTLEEKRKREENATDAVYDDSIEVTIVNTQWWEREQYWLVADDETGITAELSEVEYKEFEKQMKRYGMEVKAVQLTRRVYKEAYIGGEILSVGDAPIKGQFKWACMTGELNRTRGIWFGLMGVMKDPQMWANKWLSQTLHILNTTAKGGVMAEKDAFEDIKQAEEKWARPDTIVWVNRGALSGDKPKVLPRPGQGFQQGYVELTQFAVNALREVTGINLELIGLKDINQPGILEAMRKQAGMTVLATLFDSLRRYRKIVGRIRLFIIQNFLSDGRLIRVTGVAGTKAIPLMKSKTEGDYNVIVDDTPTSPNQKEANWAVISAMLPAFGEQLMQNPMMLLKVLEYSPLPDKLIQDLKALMQQPDPKQQQAQQLQTAAITAKVNKDQAQAELFLAQAGKEQQTAIYDLAIAMHDLQKSKWEADQAQNAHRVEMMKAPGEIDLNNAKATHERMKATLTAHQAAHEHVKALVTGMTPIDHEPPSETAARQQRHDQVMLGATQVHDKTMSREAQAHEKTMGAMGHVAGAMSDRFGRDHESREGDKGRSFEGTQAGADRQFQAGEARADREHQSREGTANRVAAATKDAAGHAAKKQLAGVE
jgi:hypothetical protein